MRTVSMICGMVLAAAVCSGCLRKDEVHAIYLSPSGVVWSVIERNVRSDETAPSARFQEEHDYVLAAGAGVHPMAQDFRRLGAQSVTTTWLRRERPYSVLTDAHFADIRQLALALLRGAQAQGDATLTRDGCQTRFGLHVEIDPAPDAPEGSALHDLVTDLDAYRLVLVDGTFVSADGFEIREDGTIAVPDAKKTASDGILTLALAWTDGSCAPAK